MSGSLRSRGAVAARAINNVSGMSTIRVCISEAARLHRRYYQHTKTPIPYGAVAAVQNAAYTSRSNSFPTVSTLNSAGISTSQCYRIHTRTSCILPSGLIHREMKRTVGQDLKDQVPKSSFHTDASLVKRLRRWMGFDLEDSPVPKSSNPDCDVLDGVRAAASLLEGVRDRTKALSKRHGIVPGIAALCVGQSDASLRYVSVKEYTAMEVRIILSVILKCLLALYRLINGLAHD
jgi:hypothetical protein